MTIRSSAVLVLEQETGRDAAISEFYECAMRRYLPILVPLILVILGWTGAWFFFGGQIQAQILTWAKGDGEIAPRLTCGHLDVSGYPFRFDVTCADMLLVYSGIQVALP